MTPLEWRADVPALAETTCFNHGAHGPSPRYVVEAATAGLRGHELSSPATDGPYEWAFAEFERTRERLASFLDVSTAR